MLRVVVKSLPSISRCRFEGNKWNSAIEWIWHVRRLEILSSANGTKNATKEGESEMGTRETEITDEILQKSQFRRFNASVTDQKSLHNLQFCSEGHQCTKIFAIVRNVKSQNIVLISTQTRYIEPKYLGFLSPLFPRFFSLSLMNMRGWLGVWQCPPFGHGGFI